MINRDNYHLVRAHMIYRDRVMQNDPGTIATYWQSLKHLLQWADARSFKDAYKIMPGFPEYLLTARNERYLKGRTDKDQGTPLTPKYMGKVLSHARAFFNWLRLHERGYHVITEAWIETMKVRRSAGTQSRLQERHYWKLEDVQKVVRLKPSSLVEKRDIAAFAFMMLSGMRIGAFVTLPLDCVDVARRRVEQLPAKGVQTKNSKAAITFLLPIPDLLEKVAEWDTYMRTLKGGAFNWYVPFTSYGVPKPGLLLGTYSGRVASFVKGLKILCSKAGVDYKSPHKIRHGFGVYGVKKSKDIKELKAISQNLMHANLGITDGIYGKLAEDDLSEIISGFGA